MPHAQPSAALFLFYNGGMDRVIDNVILLALGLGIAALGAGQTRPIALVASLLAAVIAAGLLETGRSKIFQLATEGALITGAFMEPAFCAYAAVGVYGACAQGLTWTAALWVLPLLTCWAHGNAVLAGAALLVALLAAPMALRTRGHLAEEQRLRALRDELQEKHLALAAQTRDLQERRDLEVRCAVLDERARIAREIHDNVGHLLTRAVLQTEALAVVHGADEPLARELEAVEDTLHDALNTVRASVHDLHDDAFDLHTTLEDIAGDLPTLAGTVRFEAHDVPRPVALAAAALTREGLANAAHHGNAAHATITFAEFPGFYQLTVEDDGCGLSEDRSNAGLGLISMRERAEALGGTFAFQSLAAPRTGSRLFATFPKPPGKDAQ